MAEKLIISLTVLLTGFAVVFSVLLMLIGAIKLYGTIVYKLQTRSKEKADPEKEKIVNAEPEIETRPVAVIEAQEETDDDELIAVISAAVYAAFGETPVRIKSVRKAPEKSRAWRNAGLSDSVRPF